METAVREAKFAPYKKQEGCRTRVQHSTNSRPAQFRKKEKYRQVKHAIKTYNYYTILLPREGPANIRRNLLFRNECEVNSLSRFFSKIIRFVNFRKDCHGSITGLFKKI